MGPDVILLLLSVLDWWQFGGIAHVWSCTFCPKALRFELHSLVFVLVTLRAAVYDYFVTVAHVPNSDTHVCVPRSIIVSLHHHRRTPLLAVPWFVPLLSIIWYLISSCFFSAVYYNMAKPVCLFGSNLSNSLISDPI